MAKLKAVMAEADALQKELSGKLTAARINSKHAKSDEDG
jgi:hypothetical protein